MIDQTNRVYRALSLAFEAQEDADETAHAFSEGHAEQGEVEQTAFAAREAWKRVHRLVGERYDAACQEVGRLRVEGAEIKPDYRGLDLRV